MANRSKNGEEKWSSSMESLSEAYKRRLRGELNNSSQVNDLLSWINGLNSRVRNTLGEQHEESVQLGKEEDINRLRKKRSDSSFFKNLSQLDSFLSSDISSGVGDESLKRQMKQAGGNFEVSENRDVVKPYEKEESKDEDVIEVLSSGESNASENEGMNSRSTTSNLDYDLNKGSDNENLDESLWNDVDTEYKSKRSLESNSDNGSIVLENESQNKENEEVSEEYSNAEGEENQESGSRASERNEVEISEDSENSKISNKNSEMDTKEEIEISSQESISMTSNRSPSLKEGQQSISWEGGWHQDNRDEFRENEYLQSHSISLGQEGDHNHKVADKLRIEHFLHNFDTDQKSSYSPAIEPSHFLSSEEGHRLSTDKVENYENQEEQRTSFSQGSTGKVNDNSPVETDNSQAAANYFQDKSEEISESEKDIESDKSEDTILHFKVNENDKQDQIPLGIVENRGVEFSSAEAKRLTEIAEAGLRNFDGNFLNDDSVSMKDNTLSSLAADVAASISYEQSNAFESDIRNHNENGVNKEDLRISNEDESMDNLSKAENADRNKSSFPPKLDACNSNETRGDINDMDASLEECPRIPVGPQEPLGTPMFRTIEDEDSETEYIKVKETERKFDIQLGITRALEEKLKSKGKISNIIQALEPQYSAPAMSKPILAPILSEVSEGDISYSLSCLSDASEDTSEWEMTDSSCPEDRSNDSGSDRSISGEESHSQLQDNNADNISSRTRSTSYGAVDNPISISVVEKSSESSSYGPDIYSNDFMSNSTDFFSGGGMSPVKENLGNTAAKGNEERFGSLQNDLDGSEGRMRSFYYDKSGDSIEEDDNANSEVQEPQNGGEESNIIFYAGNTVVEASNDDLLEPSAVEEPLESVNKEVGEPFVRDNINVNMLDESDIIEDDLDILYPNSVLEPYDEVFSIVEIGNHHTLEADALDPSELLFPSFVQEVETTDIGNEHVLSKKRSYGSIEEDTYESSPVKKIKTMVHNINPLNIIFKASNWVRKYYIQSARKEHKYSDNVVKKGQVEEYEQDLPVNAAPVPIPILEGVLDSTGSEEEGNSKISSGGEGDAQSKDTNTSTEGNNYSESNNNESRKLFEHHDKMGFTDSVPVDKDPSVKQEFDFIEGESSVSEKNKDKLVKHKKIFGIDVDEVDLQHEKSLRSGNTYGVPSSADSIEKKKGIESLDKNAQSYFDSQENASEVPGLSESAKSVLLKTTEDLKDYPAFRTRSKSPLKGSMQEILSVVEGEDGQNPRQRRTSTRLQETKNYRKEKHSRGRKKN